MERGLIPMNIYANDFGVIDFVNETNFDQFIDLIRGENEPDPIVNFNSQVYGDCDQRNNNNLISGCLADGQLFPPAPVPNVELFDFNVATNHSSNLSAGCSVLDQFLKDAEQEDDEDDEDDESSGTTMNTGSPRKKKGNKSDRTRTLVSERKRRGRMKEKLYTLRSLVPNITKMDKASIVGDAVLYVQDLQKQAKKLKADISNLESSLKAGDNSEGRTTQSSKNTTSLHPIVKTIVKMDIYQLEERTVYVRLVSNKAKGVAVFLYKALESLTGFNVRSSNLAASAEIYVFTFTLNVLESEMDMRLPNLKLWIASAFLDQGFDFQILLSA